MMWPIVSGLSLLSLAASVSVTASGLRYDGGPAQATGTQIPSIVPGKFIVEFQEGSGNNLRGGNVSLRLVP